MSELKNGLGFFEVMNLVIGAIVGADIYIAASFGSGFLGPASLLAWLIAGLMAITIALCFAEASSILPKVGGPYAYAKEAFGDFWGFLSGWSLLIAEWSAIAVFPLAFVAYLAFFYPNIPQYIQIIIKILFVLLLTVINLFGVRQAGKANDVLTILKIAPIILFTIIGILYFIMKPSIFLANFTPFAPLGFSGMGSALVLIFWAYIGFELVTVPADEIINPKKIIPLAIGVGMTVITLFYVVTNFVVLGAVPWMMLYKSTAPLSLAGFAVMGALGAILLTVGALFSISGSDEAGILCSARIPYAMAGDGLFPHFFAKIHPKYNTPYIALLIQSTVTLIAAIFGTISQLIILSVFTMLFSYLVTCISVFPLRKKLGRGLKLPWFIPILGIIITVYIMAQCTYNQIITGVVLIVMGIPIYVKYAPRTEIQTVKKDIELCRGYCKTCVRFCCRRLPSQEPFLAHVLWHLRRFYKKI
jgi:basic amino acid/polyamine antiporter, APA family